MPLSYLRRPLALVTFSYILFLLLLHAWGFFRTELPPEWSGVLRRPCARLEGLVVSGLQENRIGERVQLQAFGAGFCPGNGRDSTLYNLPPIRVMAYLPRRRPKDESFCPGQKILLEGRLRTPRWPRNPGEFDERSLFADRGIAGLFYSKQLEVLDQKSSLRWLPAKWAERAHMSIHRTFTALYSAPISMVLEGFLLGYKGPLDPAVAKSIQDAGVMHLLVPSGAKVAFLMMFLLWLAQRLRLNSLACSALLIVGGAFYVMIVGTEPPYIRSYLCFLIGYGAYRLGREPTGFQALVLSALCILAVEPRALFSAGFQMSYAAVLGLLIAMPRWQLPGRWNCGLRAILRALFVSVVVELMLCPILARIFGRVSVIGLMANAILVPVSGVIMGLGFAVWGCRLLGASWFLRLLAAGLGGMAHAFLWICRGFASLPMAAIDLSPMCWRQVVTYYLCVFGVLVWPERPVSCRAWGLAGLFSAFILIAGWTREPAARIIFLSHPGRRAAIVSLPDGRHILVDAGVAPSALAQAFRALGIRRLDMIFLTSEEEARGRGSGVARRLPVGRIQKVASGEAVELKYGRFRLTFGVRPGVAVLSRRDKPPLMAHPEIGVSTASGEEQSEFCILQASFRDILGDCASERSVTVGREGAVRILLNSYGYQIETQRDVYSIGRSLL